MGCLEVVTFGKCRSVSFWRQVDTADMSLWRLVTIDDCVGKTRLQSAVEKIQVLENTVKLLRCKEAHLANKCSEYCNEMFWLLDATN